MKKRLAQGDPQGLSSKRKQTGLKPRTSGFRGHTHSKDQKKKKKVKCEPYW